MPPGATGSDGPRTNVSLGLFQTRRPIPKPPTYARPPASNAMLPGKSPNPSWCATSSSDPRSMTESEPSPWPQRPELTT